MSFDSSYLRKQYERMSDEEFGAVRRADLVPEAQAVYDREAQRRNATDWRDAKAEVDRREEEFERQLESAAGGVDNADTRFEKAQLAIARQKGILRPDEQVKAFVSLFNRSQAIMVLPLLARFLLKKFVLVATDQRVLLIRVPAFAVYGGGYHNWVEHPLPCTLRLEREAAEFHQMGNRVQLPQHLAEFVGRPFGFVLRGKAAFKAAAGPATPRA